MTASPLSVSRQFIGLLGWLLLTFATAAIGSVASIQAAEFYAQLTRPEWAPPAWLFGPVWSALYLLMAISVWLVWRQAGFATAKKALLLFLAQLAANALWSWLFFAWRLGAAAFAEILLLWCLIVATVVTFWRVNRLASALLLPYLGWVTFAAVLAYHMWQLNPTLLR